MKELGTKARIAAQDALRLTTDQKNVALAAIAAGLSARKQEILAANAVDLEAGRVAGLSESLLDRLTLTEERLEGIREGICQVIALTDPVGEVLEEFMPASGIRVMKIRVPMGVIGMIYEARPNVTVDAAVLCLKAGSAVILRGGKEAIHSNTALVHVMRDTLTEQGLSADLIQLVTDTSRESANAMMHAKGYIDVLIPRGGAGLIQAVVTQATVPVIETGAGVCHTFVDASAKPEMAAEIAYNAKTSRPSVCNAMETLLVHEKIAPTFLPLVWKKMQKKSVEFRGCGKTCAVLPDAVPATAQDYLTEYGDYILNIKVVGDVAEAIEWINSHGTKHSECIVTEDPVAAERFLGQVDAAAVYHNASTRFTDGFEFGLGAEIGISTQKTHPRGPMGLREICSYKYLVRGDGQVR